MGELTVVTPTKIAAVKINTFNVYCSWIGLNVCVQNATPNPWAIVVVCVFVLGAHTSLSAHCFCENRQYFCWWWWCCGCSFPLSHLFILSSCGSLRFHWNWCTEFTIFALNFNGFFCLHANRLLCFILFVQCFLFRRFIYILFTFWINEMIESKQKQQQQQKWKIVV